MNTLLTSVANLLFPRKCPICGHRLGGWREAICTQCLSTLPHTLYHRWRGNLLEQRFYGLVPIERATSYFFYTPKSLVHSILYELKYYGNTRMGIEMGRCMATHIQAEDANFFEGIELIIPVPLASKRMKQRGYNQSAMIAKGISETTGIPVGNESLVRTVENPTQTLLKNRNQRWENVKGIFAVNQQEVHRIEGKHILLVDDVITTGATLASCAQAIKSAVPNCRISIATLAMAQI